jgi:hypothetical protein
MDERSRLRATWLEIPQDSSAARWIQAELTGEVGSVASVVPPRFAAYARIFHPAATDDGTPVRWADVADALGQDMHALAQWHTLVGSNDPDDLADSKWHGSPPVRGDLCPEILRHLCALLEGHTDCAKHCFFGLWDGWTSIQLQPGVGGKATQKLIRSGDELVGPRFGLPPQAGRDYVLLCGPIWAAMEIARFDETIGFWPTSPNLIWPKDRSWFLASEIDFDSTLVGGSNMLVQSVVKSSEIEAWRVHPHDSLAAFG